MCLSVIPFAEAGFLGLARAERRPLLQSLHATHALRFFELSPQGNAPFAAGEPAPKLPVRPEESGPVRAAFRSDRATLPVEVAVVPETSR